MDPKRRTRVLVLVLSLIVMTAASTASKASSTGTCAGQSITIPFDDVAPANVFFCSIAEAFFSGLANGTTPTTYSPGDPVLREQMAAFITRTMDQSLRRGSERAGIGRYFTPTSPGSLALTSVGDAPLGVRSDGADLWVANNLGGTISRVQASDGKLLQTWTGATTPRGVLVAKNRIFITGTGNPGNLYQIDPTQTPGAVTTVTSSLGANPSGIAFDGSRVWTANSSSVSIVTLNPIAVTTVTAGMVSPAGPLFDGSNIWTTDPGDGSLKKLDANGNVLQTISVGSGPRAPVFDGTNIWVPSLGANSVTVVRAATGAILATLTGNGLTGPYTATFDGERILITNFTGDSVSLWKAADFTPLGTFSTGADSAPQGACSDGLNFWIALNGTDKLARF